MVNKRIHQRRRVLKGAKVLFNGKSSVIDCTVRDMSAGGAKLRLVSTIGVPDRFVLQLPAEEGEHPCCVAWRSGTEIGVTFDAWAA